ERDAAVRELPGVSISEAFGTREALVDASVFVDAGQVLWRRDERDRPRLAERRLSDFDQPDVLRRRGEAPEVLDRLVVGEELRVSSHVESEHCGWRGNLLGCRADWLK